MHRLSVANHLALRPYSPPLFEGSVERARLAADDLIVSARTDATKLRRLTDLRRWMRDEGAELEVIEATKRPAITTRANQKAAGAFWSRAKLRATPAVWKSAGRFAARIASRAEVAATDPDSVLRPAALADLTVALNARLGEMQPGGISLAWREPSPGQARKVLMVTGALKKRGEIKSYPLLSGAGSQLPAVLALWRAYRAHPAPRQRLALREMAAHLKREYEITPKTLRQYGATLAVDAASASLPTDPARIAARAVALRHDLAWTRRPPTVMHYM